MGLLSRYKKEKLVSEAYYKTIGQVDCPFFWQPVTFNSDGFNHLQFSAGNERDKPAQMLKFNLLELAPNIVKKSGTIQEYRKQWGTIGRKKTNGSHAMKEIEYWGLIAIVKNKEDKFIKIKVILRRVGTGNVIFWSVMPEVNIRRKDTFSLATGDITDD